MRRDTENYCWSGKLFWKVPVREGILISLKPVVVAEALLQQLVLQISATNVSIRVQRRWYPGSWNRGVTISGR